MGRGTNLFQAFGKTPPGVAMEPVSALRRKRAREICHPPRLPAVALRQTFRAIEDVLGHGNGNLHTRSITTSLGRLRCGHRGTAPGLNACESMDPVEMAAAVERGLIARSIRPRWDRRP